MSHFQKESGGSVTVHHPRSPSVSCRPFPIYKDGQHFLSPCKSETGGARHASRTGVNSEMAPRAQLEACPPEEPDEENLAKRSSVE